jgi:hypothetical protein
MDNKSWEDEKEKSAEFRGEVRQFIKQMPETMKALTAEAILTHNEDKEAHPKQRLSFVLSIAALGASIFAPAAWERLKEYLNRPVVPADSSQVRK